MRPITGDTKQLRDLVADWGGFERLVADLNQTGDVSVEHDVKLTGKSGAIRQIDVLLRHRQGLYEHLIVIECKYWKKCVGRRDVEALVMAVQDLNASRGVLFTVKGFESGAIMQAKQSGIDLFTVREPTDEEWGLPGRHVDFFIDYISRSFGDLTVEGVSTVGVVPSARIDIRFGLHGAESQTPIQPFPGLKEVTFEALLLGLVDQAVREAWKPEVLFDGRPGERKFWRQAEAVITSPIIIPQPFGLLLVPKLRFRVGLKILQTRFQMDRGERFVFVLAVEDHIRNLTMSASKEKNTITTSLSPLAVQNDPEQGPPLQNGTIISVFLASFFSFDEVRDLTENEFGDVINTI